MVSTRAKDCYKFLTTVNSFTDGQVQVSDWDSDFLSWILLDVVPSQGPYRGAKFKFRIKIGRDFPRKPPGLTCMTNIYHPNIDPTSGNNNVCLNLLDEWESNFGLVDCVQGILFLFYHPNESDPLSPYFTGEEEDNFYRTVRLILTGRTIEDYEGPRLIEDDEEIQKFLEELEQEANEAEINVSAASTEVEDETNEDNDNIAEQTDQPSQSNEPVASASEDLNEKIVAVDHTCRASDEADANERNDDQTQENSVMENSVISHVDTTDALGGSNEAVASCGNNREVTNVSDDNADGHSCDNNETNIKENLITHLEITNEKTDTQKQESSGINQIDQTSEVPETVRDSTCEANENLKDSSDATIDIIPLGPSPASTCDTTEVDNAIDGNSLTHDIYSVPQNNEEGACSIGDSTLKDCSDRQETEIVGTTDEAQGNVVQEQTGEKTYNNIDNERNEGDSNPQDAIHPADAQEIDCEREQYNRTEHTPSPSTSTINESCAPETGNDSESATHTQENNENKCEENMPALNAESTGENDSETKEASEEKEPLDMNDMLEKVKVMMDLDPKYERPRRSSDSEDDCDEEEEEEMSEEECEPEVDLPESPIFMDKSTQTEPSNWDANLGEYLTEFKTISYVAPDYDNTLMFIGATLLYTFYRLFALNR